MPELVPSVTIQLDKPRNLKLTLGGMKRFQEVTGKSLLKGFNFDNMDENELIAFIWACLIWEDRKLSLEDVGFLLDVNQLPKITEKLKDVVVASVPERKDETPLVENRLTG